MNPIQTFYKNSILQHKKYVVVITSADPNVKDVFNTSFNSVNTEDDAFDFVSQKMIKKVKKFDAAIMKHPMFKSAEFYDRKAKTNYAIMTIYEFKAFMLIRFNRFARA